MTSEVKTEEAGAYAIVVAGGRQFKAVEGRHLRIPSIQANPGETVKLAPVLAVFKGAGDFEIGKPQVDGTHAEAKVLRHGRAAKVVNYKYKRRKGYHRKVGHRQGFTEVLVTKLVVKGDS